MLQDILLLIVGAVLGFVGQVAWRHYEQRQDRGASPDVAVTTEKHDGSTYVVLHNIGQDDIRELGLQAEWVDGADRKEQTLNTFFRTNPVTESGYSTEFIGHGEKLLVKGIPQETSEGIVKIIVRGLGVKSSKLFSHESDIEVRRKSDNP